mgnify:CR=1 FL=1
MGVVLTLPSVRLTGLRAAGIRILAAVDSAAQLLKRDLTVTCGVEGHPPTDPHTQGAALDLRTKDFLECTVLALVAALKKTLGPDFTVLYEVPSKPLGVLASIAYVNPDATAPHVHVQLKRGFGPYPAEGA